MIIVSIISIIKSCSITKKRSNVVFLTMAIIIMIIILYHQVLQHHHKTFWCQISHHFHHHCCHHVYQWHHKNFFCRFCRIFDYDSIFSYANSTCCQQLCKNRICFCCNQINSVWIMNSHTLYVCLFSLWKIFLDCYHMRELFQATILCPHR